MALKNPEGMCAVHTEKMRPILPKEIRGKKMPSNPRQHLEPEPRRRARAPEVRRCEVGGGEAVHPTPPEISPVLFFWVNHEVGLI